MARVSLRAIEILQKLNEKELADPDSVRSLWRPEYGAYMIEGTPGKPYGSLLAHFNVIEANMKYRREEVAGLLLPNETVMSITNFPRLGCPQFTEPPYEVRPDDVDCSARSNFFPDEAIFPGRKLSYLINKLIMNMNKQIFSLLKYRFHENIIFN